MDKRRKLNQKEIRELQDTVSDSKSSGREVRRAMAVLQINEGVAIKTIVSQTMYSRRQIFDLRKNYLDKGISAIEDKKKGKPREILTKKQLTEIVTIIKEKTPKDYGYDTDYWTTGIVGAVIEQEYKVKQAKFTFHKPGRIYQKHNQEEVEKWKIEAKTRIEQALKEKDTVVLVEDEMSLSTQTTTQKIWLPQGEYPQIQVATKRDARSIYGFLNIKTGRETAFKTGWQNMYETYCVLEELRKIYPNQKIFLIWDKAPSHKGWVTQYFLQADGQIATFDFPRAAPEYLLIKR